MKRVLLCGQRPDEYTEEANVTALHKAASSGEIECLRVLLEAGADVLKKGFGNATPLHYAAGSGKLKAVELLLEYGAKECLYMYVGDKNPAMMASESGHEEVAKLLQNVGKCKWLIITCQECLWIYKICKLDQAGKFWHGEQ